MMAKMWWDWNAEILLVGIWSAAAALQKKKKSFTVPWQVKLNN